MSGWAALGDMLAGGVQRDAEDEYAGQLKKNYDAFGSLEKARNERAMRMYRDQLPQAVKAMGLPPEVAAILGASASPDMRNLGTYQDPYAKDAYERRALAAGLIPLSDGSMPAPDDSVVNRMTSLLDNKPMRVTDVQDGVMFNPYNQEQKGTITPIGEATIGRNEAAARASDASVRQRDSSKALNEARTTSVNDRTNNPDKYRAPKSDKKPDEKKPATTKPAASKKVAPPKAGEVRNGYKFKGGDPNNKANWKKV